jgi:hypothetical protein
LKENEFAIIEIKGSVLIFRYKPMPEVTIQIARTCVAFRVAACAGQSYLSLFDLRAVKSFPKESRDYLANEGSDFVIASALLVNSTVMKMAVNFFISVNKPKIPTRMFTTEQEAIGWLKQQQVAVKG